MQQAISKVLARQDLSADEMTTVMHTIMTGGATPAQRVRQRGRRLQRCGRAVRQEGCLGARSGSARGDERAVPDT